MKFKRVNMEFLNKSILTSGMLKEIYSYPRELERLIYCGFSDGVIHGLNYEKNSNGELILTAGMIRIKNRQYILSENVNISKIAAEHNLVTDQRYFITLRTPETNQIETNIEEESIELEFTQKPQGMTLGTFIYHPQNIQLPQLSLDSDPFADLFKASIFDATNVLYSMRNSATFHPIIFNVIRQYLTRHKREKTMMDYAMQISLDMNGILPWQTILSYIDAENGQDTFRDRREVLQVFCQCLKTSKPPIIYSVPKINEEESISKIKKSSGQMLR